MDNFRGAAPETSRDSIFGFISKETLNYKTLVESSEFIAFLHNHILNHSTIGSLLQSIAELTSGLLEVSADIISLGNDIATKGGLSLANTWTAANNFTSTLTKNGVAVLTTSDWTTFKTQANSWTGLQTFLNAQCSTQLVVGGEVQAGALQAQNVGCFITGRGIDTTTQGFLDNGANVCNHLVLGAGVGYRSWSIATNDLNDTSQALYIGAVAGSNTPKFLFIIRLNKGVCINPSTTTVVDTDWVSALKVIGVASATGWGETCLEINYGVATTIPDYNSLIRTNADAAGNTATNTLTFVKLFSGQLLRIFRTPQAGVCEALDMIFPTGTVIYSWDGTTMGNTYTWVRNNINYQEFSVIRGNEKGATLILRRVYMN